MLPDAPVAAATAAAAAAAKNTTTTITTTTTTTTTITTTTTTTATATATDTTAANDTTSTIITSIATAATDTATHSATIAIDTATTARATVAVLTTAVSLDAAVVTTSPNATDSTMSPKSVDSNAASATHKMMELQISAVNENNAVPDVSTNDYKSPNVHNKSTSITIRPINEFTTGLKRALSNAMVVNDKFKKCKLTVGDEEINVPSLVNSDNQEDKGHNDVKKRKLKNCITIKKISDVKKVNDCSSSNEIPKENSVKDIPDKQNDGPTFNLSAENHKVYSPSKKYVCKEVGGENQSSNIKRISQMKIIETQTIEDSENDNSFQLNNSSCLFKIISVEGADKNDDNADNFPPLAKSIISADNVASITKSVLSDDQDILSENRNKTIATEEENKSSLENNKPYEVVLSTDLINKISNGITQMADDIYPQILEVFKQKNLTFHQFESICTRKILEVVTQKLEIGKQREYLQMILEKEKSWQKKYSLLNRQCKELRTIINMHKNELKTNPYAKPHLVTRTVGLQATLSPKNNSSVQLSKANTTSTSVQPDEPIDITSDNDSDVIELDTVDPQPSCSNTAKCATNTTPNKQIPSITKALPINGTIKSVPPAVPIVNNDKNCIDLTDDDIEVSNGVSLDKSPVKIVQSPAINADVPAQLTTTKPHALPKSITYIELPNLAKSSYIVRTQSSTEHNQNANTTSLKSIDQEPNNGSILYTSEQYLPVQLAPNIATKLVKQSVSVGQTLKPIQIASTLKPVNINHRSLKSGIPFITNKISASTPIGSLQPVPAAIPLKKHPAPLPATPTARSVASSQKPPPAPKISLAPGTEEKEDESVNSPSSNDSSENASRTRPIEAFRIDKGSKLNVSRTKDIDVLKDEEGSKLNETRTRDIEVLKDEEGSKLNASRTRDIEVLKNEQGSKLNASRKRDINNLKVGKGSKLNVMPPNDGANENVNVIYTQTKVSERIRKPNSRFKDFYLN